jgi:hypothetical protein
VSRPVALGLFVLQLALLLFGLIRGAQMEELKALLEERNLLPWFASLERATAALCAVLIACGVNDRTAPKSWPRAWWSLASLALAISAADVYFGPARALGSVFGRRSQAVEAIFPLLWSVLAAGLLFALRREIRLAESLSRRALLAWMLLALLAIGLGLLGKLPIVHRFESRLEVAAFSAGYLATYCLLLALYAHLRQRSGAEAA